MSTSAAEADANQIEWGFNCLTGGPHHGRPEKIWNLPLVQTQYMFTPEQLQELVVDRIFNDAMQFVENSSYFEEMGNKPYTKEWAERVKKAAAPQVLVVFDRKVKEIEKYYASMSFKSDLYRAIERNKENKLNPGYEVSHPHDTINLLCRMVGQGALYDAAKNQGE